MKPTTPTSRCSKRRLLAGLLLMPLAGAAMPTPAFALRAVGLEEGSAHDELAESLQTPNPTPLATPAAREQGTDPEVEAAAAARALSWGVIWNWVTRDLQSPPVISWINYDEKERELSSPDGAREAMRNAGYHVEANYYGNGRAAWVKSGLEEVKELTLERTKEILGVAPPVGATHGLWVPAASDRTGTIVPIRNLYVVDQTIRLMDIPNEFWTALNRIENFTPTDFSNNDIALALTDTRIVYFKTPPQLTIRLADPADAGTLDLAAVRAAIPSIEVIYWHPNSAQSVELAGHQGYLFYA